MGLLGLGRRAGGLFVGTGAVRAAIKADKTKVIVVASDLSDRTVDKVLPLAEARGTWVLAGPSALELGRAIGAGAVQVVGVRDAGLASGLLKHLEEFEAGGICGEDAGT